MHPSEDEFRLAGDVPESANTISFTGTDIQKRIRAGLLKGFTGVDDPYEDPPAPEIRIDTTTLTPDEAAQEVMLFISRRSFI